MPALPAVVGCSVALPTYSATRARSFVSNMSFSSSNALSAATSCGDFACEIGNAKSAGSHGVVDHAGVASSVAAGSEAEACGFRYGAGLVTLTVGNVGMTSLIDGTIGFASLPAATAPAAKPMHE